MAMSTGILLPVDFSSEQTLVLDEYLRQVFVNETPLLTRLPRVPGMSEKFSIVSYQPRPRAVTYASGAATSAPDAGTVEEWTFADATGLLPGDVLENGTERVTVTEVTAATKAKVMRGAAGTTVAAGASVSTTALATTLIGNSRHGNEVDQSAYRAPRTVADQYHQRFLFPVQVGGATMDMGNIIPVRSIPGVPNPSGIAPGGDPLSQGRVEKLIDMVRDMEYSLLYGKAEAATATATRKMSGLRYLIDSGNVTTNPGTASAYTPAMFVADVFQKAYNGGGMVDVVFMSLGWMTGLHTWGYAKTTIFNLGQNVLGAPIEGFVLPFHGRDVTFIPCPLLGTATSFAAIGVTSEEVAISVIRPETWFPRGRRGDAYEGDWIADISLKLINPKHHAWVSGVTGFAA